ncbi:hypothetical protein, partial [Treponema sp. R6D11]
IKVYIPTLGEYEKYHSCKQSIYSGHWSYLNTQGSFDFLAAIVDESGKTDSYGVFSNTPHGGITPSINASRDSDIFRSVELTNGFNVGSEFDLIGCENKCYGLFEPKSPIRCRIEMVEGNRIIFRPTFPIAFSKLYQNLTFGTGVC